MRLIIESTTLTAITMAIHIRPATAAFGLTCGGWDGALAVVVNMKPTSIAGLPIWQGTV